MAILPDKPTHEPQQGASKDFRKWQRELLASEKREKDWFKNAEALYRLYRGEGRKKNSYNIFTPNTETLHAAIYNSLPKPDVRRRFKDSDPIGKAVAEVLERAISYSLDAYGFDGVAKFSVLDSLVTGRGVARIRYIPSLRQVGDIEQTGEESAETDLAHEAYEGTEEEVEFEKAVVEHVDWRDFRRGFGRIWDEVQWVAFRHQLKKDDVTRQFGEEVADAIEYAVPSENEDEKRYNKSDADNMGEERTAEFWEIWDKEGKNVCFYQENYRKGMIYPLDNPDGSPPINFEDFYPIPNPLRLFTDSTTVTPVPLYESYREQADELNLISQRIIKVTRVMKLRGIYDSGIAEIASLMDAGDNDLIGVTNAAQWSNGGGLDKAIAWMPSDQLVKILQGLYDARERCKASIYELTGLSDIIRGASVASETATAQQIKAQYASIRLKKMQSAVQAYMRDLIRLMAEVIGEKFSPQTLQQMTGLQFPTMEMKQQAQMQAQMQQQPQQPGQPPQQPPEQLQAMLSMPTWEDIMPVMQNDLLRQFHVDVETDSTVASTIESDMQGLEQVLTGLVQFWQGSGPAVMSGALPIEAVKEISLSIVRRSKLGLAVEDAIEKMQQPKPPSQPQDNSMQVEQMRQQGEQQNAQMKQQTEQARLQAEQQHEQQMAQIESQREQFRMQMEARTAEQEMAFNKWKAELEASTQITCAQISAKVASDNALLAAESAASARESADLGESNAA